MKLNSIIEKENDKNDKDLEWKIKRYSCKSI
jgi:hypothetical protein